MRRSASADFCRRHKRANGAPTYYMDNIFSAGLAAFEKYKMKKTAQEVNSRHRIASKTIKDNKKGFLASIDNLLRGFLLPLCLVLYGLSFTPYAKQILISDTLIQVIAGGMTITLIAIGILACLTSMLKNSKSVDGAAFQIVKWLLLPVMLFPITLLWIALHFSAKISKFFVCPIGSMSNLAILYIWYCYFCIEQPKVSMKIVLEKMGCFRHRFRQDQRMYRANLSSAAGTCTTELRHGDFTLPIA